MCIRDRDNNLAACMFYLKNGFVIGGLNTHVYTGTSQEGKKTFYFILMRSDKADPVDPAVPADSFAEMREPENEI